MLIFFSGFFSPNIPEKMLSSRVFSFDAEAGDGLTFFSGIIHEGSNIFLVWFHPFCVDLFSCDINPGDFFLAGVFDFADQGIVGIDGILGMLGLGSFGMLGVGIFGMLGVGILGMLGVGSLGIFSHDDPPVLGGSAVAIGGAIKAKPITIVNANLMAFMIRKTS